MQEECTDGKVRGWDCAVSIIGCTVQGYDLRCSPYTMGDDESAPSGIEKAIYSIEGSFKSKTQARRHAERLGFVPAIEWGEMHC